MFKLISLNNVIVFKLFASHFEYCFKPTQSTENLWNFRTNVWFVYSTAIFILSFSCLVVLFKTVLAMVITVTCSKLCLKMPQTVLALYPF